MGLSGDLAEFTLPEILDLLSRGARSGTLLLPDASMTISLVDGAISAVAAHRDQLKLRLLHALPPDALLSLDGADSVASLAGLGLLEAERIREIAADDALDQLATGNTDQGAFHWRSDEIVDPIGLRLQPHETCERAAARRAEVAEALTVVGGIDQVLHFGSGPLGDVDAALLAAIDGDRPISASALLVGMGIAGFLSQIAPLVTRGALIVLAPGEHTSTEMLAARWDIHGRTGRPSEPAVAAVVAVPDPRDSTEEPRSISRAATAPGDGSTQTARVVDLQRNRVAIQRAIQELGRWT